MEIKFDEVKIQELIERKAQIKYDKYSDKLNDLQNIVKKAFPNTLEPKGTSIYYYKSYFSYTWNAWYSPQEKLKIYNISDFLIKEKTYTVTREQLNSICDKYKKDIKYNTIIEILKEFANRFIPVLCSQSIFREESVANLFNNSVKFNQNILKEIFPDYEKPKVKKELVVYCNIYDNNKTYHGSFYEAEKSADDTCRAIAVELKGNYEI